MLDAKPEADRIQAVWEALDSVTDPEIPVLPIIEMGMVSDVRVDRGVVNVDITPTFAGCPALDVIRSDVQQAVLSSNEPTVVVNIVFEPAWTSDRITEKGRGILKSFGLAPPGPGCHAAQAAHMAQTPCPFCDSKETKMESMFGPTLCRSIHYCHSCHQSFEHFKAI